MKEAIKGFLFRKGLYYPLRYSVLFRVYEHLFKPAEIRKQQKEVIFYKSFLPPCHLIFDIGAYDGHKTVAFLQFSPRVVCCEPDEENYRLLTARFRNKKGKVSIENKAVSDKEGMAEYLVHHPGSAFNTLSPKWKLLLEEDKGVKWNEDIQFSGAKQVQATTLDRLITIYGKPDFIKIDVEGFEQSVLKGLSQRIAWLSFETLLPDYRGELKNCLEAISKLDESSMFNVANDESLLFNQFLNKNELEKWAENYNEKAHSFEIIVKMKA